jgi:4-amino-4-deoxy-L-arabinose transferase-like glycosyltransferase
MSRRARWIFSMLILLYMVRLFLIGFLQLAVDEAHYWYWSQHLQWSYYDHPPMVAWIMAFFTNLGGNTEFFVRLGGFLCTVCTDILLYLTAKTLCPKHRELPWEILLISNLTLLHAGGSIIQTPDTPQLLFWTLALYSGAKLLTGAPAGWWYVAGGALGLGLLSKYTMILILPCTLAFLLLSRAHRHWLRRKEPYLAVLLGFLMFSPVVWWNWQHQWVSFAFQLGQGFSPVEGAKLDKLLNYLGGQAGVVTPLWFGAFVFYSLWGGYKASPPECPAYLYLALLSWPILIFFGLSTLRGETAEANWPAPTYAAGLLLMWIVYRRHFAHRLWHRRLAMASLGLALQMNLLLHVHLLTPILPIPPRLDTTKRLQGWRDLGRKIDELMAQYPAETGHFLVASRGLTTVAEAVFYTGNRFMGIDFFRPQELTFIHNIEQLTGKDALILIEGFEASTIDRYRLFFRDVRLIATHAFVYRGHSLQRLRLHILYGQSFQGNWRPHIP